MDWADSSDAIVSPASDVNNADALSLTDLLACASIMSKTSLTGTGGSRERAVDAHRFEAHRVDAHQVDARQQRLHDRVPKAVDWLHTE